VHDLGFGTGPMMRWETGAHELFTAAVTAALDAAAPGSALLDLSRLSFLSAGCARDLLRLAEAHAPGRVIVRCATAHARTLRQLGAARVPGLILTEADGPR
jgi:hypothetical protein